MSDGFWLYLVLVLLYLSDCFVLIRQGDVLLLSTWLNNWKITTGLESLSSFRKKLYLLNPFKVIEPGYLGRWGKIALSPDGISSYNKMLQFDSTEVSTFTFNEINEIKRREKKVEVNGSLFTEFVNETEAISFKNLIDTILEADTEKHETIINDYIYSRFDLEILSRTYEKLTRSISHIDYIAYFFFLIIYLIIPFAAYRYGLIPYFFWFVAILLAGGILLSILYFISHKKLFAADRSERIANLLKMILCPPTAIRSGSLLKINALYSFHPFLIALFLENKNTIIHSLLVKYKYPIKNEGLDEKTLRIINWFYKKELSFINRLVEKETPEILVEIDKEPDWDGDSLSYCPRCQTQYVKSEGECADCSGINLVGFEEKVKPE